MNILILSHTSKQKMSNYLVCFYLQIQKNGDYWGSDGGEKYCIQSVSSQQCIKGEKYCIQSVSSQQCIKGQKYCIQSVSSPQHIKGEKYCMAG